jgi:hypothetical protein
MPCFILSFLPRQDLHAGNGGAFFPSFSLCPIPMSGPQSHANTVVFSYPIHMENLSFSIHANIPQSKMLRQWRHVLISKRAGVQKAEEKHAGKQLLFYLCVCQLLLKAL